MRASRRPLACRHVQAENDRLDIVAADERDAPLFADEVRIWVADLRHYRPSCGEEILGVGELERSKRFRTPELRARFVKSHLFLRERLSAVLDEAPTELQFARRPCTACGGPHGKPFLAGNTVSFNMSHSDDLVLLAATATAGEVGADVESWHQARSLLTISETFTTPHERAQIARRDTSEQPRALLACWVRKEALLKARGDGLNLPPTAVEVSPDEPQTGQVHVVSVSDQAWRIVDLVLPGAFAAIGTRAAGVWLSIHHD
jgi:4'-phosphopantetheinyl transferase